MINRVVKRQQGVALIQVLLVSTIISLLALSFTFTARNQINTALAFEQRVIATQQLKTVQKKVIYTLLTQNNSSTKYALFPMSEPWNFYGKPFVLEENEQIKITMSLQDNAGLLSQQHIKWPFWRVVLQSMSYTDNRVREIQGQVTDWQDRDTESWLIGDKEPDTLAGEFPYRNLRIQLPQEINWFFKDNSENLALIKQISTNYSSIGFNIKNAPNSLVNLLLPIGDAAEFIRLRETRLLTTEVAKSFLDDQYDEEYLIFYPARQIKLTVAIETEAIELYQSIQVKIQPREDIPLLILSRQ